MVTLTADVTDNIKHMTQELVKKGMYKSQSEVVRDAIRQLALKYRLRETDITTIRKKMTEAGKKSGKKMSEAVRELRNES